jgi:CheY-like chemotaxis protein
MFNILVAEDDKFLASAYRVKFTKQGWNVTIVEDGHEVIEFLEKQKSDLVLLDLIMPNMDGFEVLEQIFKNGQNKKVPVIVASNLGQKEDIDRAMSLGAKDFIVKSESSLDAIVTKISAFLKKK